MAIAAKRQYQNTTLRMPSHVFAQARKVVMQSQASSFNEFVVQAIEEKVRRLGEAEIDAAFAQMGKDSDYQRETVAMAREFENSDWQVVAASERHEGTKIRTAKTRSR